MKKRLQDTTVLPVGSRWKKPFTCKHLRYLRKKKKGKTKSIDGKAVNMDNSSHGWAPINAAHLVSEMLWASDAFVSPHFPPLRNKNIPKVTLCLTHHTVFGRWGRWVKETSGNRWTQRAMLKGQLRNPPTPGPALDDVVLDFRWYSHRMRHVMALGSSEHAVYGKGQEPLQAWGQTVAGSLPLLESRLHEATLTPDPELACMTNSKQGKRQYHSSETVASILCVLSLSRIIHSWENHVVSSRMERGAVGWLPASRHMGAHWKHMIQTRLDYRWQQPQLTPKFQPTRDPEQEPS